MDIRLSLGILPQPDDVSCGPTCLHAVYTYFGDNADLMDIARSIVRLPSGGSLAVTLAVHALRRGYKATIYTYNFRLFDPTWFDKSFTGSIRDKLERQAQRKPGDSLLQFATRQYIEFLALGGEVRSRELSGAFIRDTLRADIPILTGLSATYLFSAVREIDETNEPDDIAGEPVAHFVVLAGYHHEHRKVLVADPLRHNPGFSTHFYEVGMERLIGAICLGAHSMHANLLLIEPRRPRSSRA